MQRMKNENGMVLVLAMVFLAVMSLLALNLLNASLLETKMSSYYQNKVLAFYKAEDYLEQYEQAILDGEKADNAKIIDTSICGVAFYRVFADAEHNGVSSKVQSTFAKTVDAKSCELKPESKVTEGRHSFLVLSK